MVLPEVVQSDPASKVKRGKFLDDGKHGGMTSADRNRNSFLAVAPPVFQLDLPHDVTHGGERGNRFDPVQFETLAIEDDLGPVPAQPVDQASARRRIKRQVVVRGEPELDLRGACVIGDRAARLDEAIDLGG